MEGHDDLLNQIMDASQPEAPASGPEPEETPGFSAPPGRRGTDEPSAGADEECPRGRSESERTLPFGSPAGRFSGPPGKGGAREREEECPSGRSESERTLPRRVSRETAPSKRERRTPARLGYGIIVLLAANLLALLAVCLVQYRANQAVMDAVQETLGSLQAVERLEGEKKALQEQVGELEENEQNLRNALTENWIRQDELERNYTVATILWVAREAFEAEQYELCADILRYLFNPEDGVGLGFNDWNRFSERIDYMALRLMELGHLKQDDVTFLLYGEEGETGAGNISLGTVTVTIPGGMPDPTAQAE